MSKMESEIAIAWIDLTFKIKTFLMSNEKIILNGLYGSVNFGTINALMGPSGAGKTTLLKCLNGKNKSGLGKETKIFLNSREKIRTCFIGQYEKEQLIMDLTAKQNMIYASKLKNSDENVNIDHENNVMDLLSDFMISDIVDTKVNDCSGGQQRRLSIAIEMTAYNKPNLLCIDEPTTGLDSNAAEKVMECLKLLSQKNKISIITSIHQPNNDIIMMFNKLYVLAKTGVCVYSGLPKYLSNYLSKCGINCNKFQVPIEVLLKIVSNESNDELITKLEKNTSQERESINEKCLKETKLFPNGIEFKSKSFKLIDVWYLLIRGMTQTYISQWKSILAQLLFYIFFALIMTKMFNPKISKPDSCFSFIDTKTTCFEQLDDDSILDQNIKFVFFTSVMVMFIQLSVSTLTFVTDIKIFLNEHQNRWYSTGTYFFAKNIVELLPTLIYSICFAYIAYYSSGQILDNERIFWYTFIITMGMLCTQGLGFLIGIIFKNFEQMAIMIAIGFYCNLIMFCNFYIMISEMPQLFQLYAIISYPKYVFNSILIIIYGLDRCSEDQFSLTLFKYGVNDQIFWLNVKALLIYCLTLRILAYILLYIKTNSLWKQNKNKISLSETNILRKKQSLAISENFSTIGNFVYSAEINQNLNNNYDNELLLKNEMRIENELSIAWIDLTLNSPKRMFSDEKKILLGINGCIELGSLTALMGPSGAGKTSLLKSIINMNSDQLSEDTKIYLNKFERIRTCFISQDERDHLLKGLTAKQALIYASRLKNSDLVADHEKIAQNIMEELLITNTSNTSVEKCSGGEQKRIVIAMELTSVKMPNLLCIDEPTSGLDSNAAEVVIKCLNTFSQKHNISIITSIHQPNSDLITLFHKIYVLAKEGVCVFSGEPQELEKHLQECDIKCNEFQTPIEVLLKYACNGTQDKHIIQLMNKTLTQRENILIKCHKETQHFMDGIQMISKRFKLINLWVHLNRTLTHTYRYFWKVLLIQFITYIILGFCLRLLFDSQIGNPRGCIDIEEDFNITCNKTAEKLEEESLLTQNIKYNFFSITIMQFFQLISTTLIFANDIKIFLNEHKNGWYSTGVYYWSKSIVELIPTLITIIGYVYVIDIYNNNTVFVAYIIFATFGVLSMQNIGHIIGIIFSNNSKIAVFFSVGFFVMLFLFSNFLIPIKELHYSLQWVSNLSAVKLIFECILILFYGFGRCFDNEISTVLYLFEIDDNTYYKNIRFLIYQFIFLRCLTLIALLLKVNPISNSKKGAEIRKFAVKTMKPYNAYIPGLNSHYEYKVKPKIIV